MGADHFHQEIKTDAGVGEAFNKAVAEAEWEHGHGGYTGTLAEKDSYIVLPMPEGVAAWTFDQALAELSYSLDDTGENFDPAKVDEGLCKQLVVGTPKDTLLSWIRAYDNKWGPAIAVKTDDGWAFFGYASS